MGEYCSIKYIIIKEGAKLHSVYAYLRNLSIEKRKGMYFDSISIRKSSTNKYEEKNYSYVRHEAKRK